MERKLAGFIFVLLLILSGAISAYGECVDAAHHLNSSTEEDTPSIHCPEVALSSSVQKSPPVRSYSLDLGKILKSVGATGTTFVPAARFKEHSFLNTFSQQHLYRFEEVLRL